MSESQPPICDYEGSSYQSAFWEHGGREYEDRVEAIALRRILPPGGRRLLEVGAGAGRNTPRYAGFEQIVLFDYSRSQLEQAQRLLGTAPRYIYVVGDVYRLPFSVAVFDAATMIRTLHHLAEPARALGRVSESLVDGSTFILEYANKRNLKAVLRWLLGRQDWNPFAPDMHEFAELNFNFHPQHVRQLLEDAGFQIGRQLTVSHFRIELLKRIAPLGLLVAFDAALQWSGGVLQLTPSVFIEAILPGAGEIGELEFMCPSCGGLRLDSEQLGLRCGSCTRLWEYRNGIFDFKSPLDG